MSKPSHSSSSSNVQDLDQEPQSKDKSSRYRDDPDEKKQKNQGQDTGLRIENQICPKDACNGSTGSDHGNLRIGIKKDMGEGSS